MARMSNKRRLEWSFFLNDRSRITYNELCRKCQHECKQSFRAVVVDCPKYLSKRSKKKDKTAADKISNPRSAFASLRQGGCSPSPCAAKAAIPFLYLLCIKNGMLYR